MNEPIPIMKDTTSKWTVEEEVALRKQKFAQRTAAVVLSFGALIVVALLTPLVVFLTRLAGGW